MTLSDPAQPDDLALDGHTVRVRAMYGYRSASGGTILTGALRYDLTHGAARVGQGSWRHDSYHAPSLRLGILQKIRAPWGVMAYVLGGVGSDMEGLRWRDARVTVGAGVTYMPGPHLRCVFGGMYTTAFYIPLPLPLVAVRYRTGPIQLQLQVPQGASAWYSPWPALDLGLKTEVLNLRYGLHDPQRFADEYNALNVVLGPVVRAYLHRGLYLMGEGGYNVRHFRVTRSGQVTFRELTFQGWYTAATVGYMM